MIGSKPTDVIDPRWPGPCWTLGCCWSPPPAVTRKPPPDDGVTRCCLCRQPISITETVYLLRNLVTHVGCGAPVLIEALDPEARS